MKLWTGNEKLDALRSKAAASPTGCVLVSIEELNAILPILSEIRGVISDEQTKGETQ